MKKYIKCFGNVLSILSVVFITRALFKMEIDYGSISNNNKLLVIAIIGSIVFSITVLILGIAWVRILNYFSISKVNFKEGSCVYARANLGKYLPGNVMHYVERNVFIAKYDLSQTQAAFSSVIEVIGLVLATSILSICMSADNFMHAFQRLINKKYMIVICCILILLLIILLLAKKFNLVKRIRKKIFSKKFFKMFFVNILIYMVVFLFLGVILVLLVNSIGTISLNTNEVFLVISTYTIAWIFGFITPGAPGGIGVREFVISVLIHDSALRGTVLLAAVIHRVITIIGDILCYLIAIWIGRNKNGNHEFKKEQ